MLKTRLIEDCYEYRVDADTIEYRIEIAVIDKGELPQTPIFIYSMGNPDDPATDVFARVASPGDLNTYASKTRDQLIIEGKTEYLASSMSISYPQLNVAVQAKSVLKSRINECINNWVAYKVEFLNDGSIPTIFPTTDPEYIQALTSAYVDARDERHAQEDVVTAAEVTLALAEKDAATAVQILAIYQTEAVFCQQARITDWNNISAAITLFKTGSQTQLSLMKSTFVTLANAEHVGSVVQWPPTSGELTALGGNWTAWYNEMAALSTGWEARINAYGTTGDPLAADLTSAFATFCQTASANVVTYTNLKNAADLAVTEAVQAKQEAEAALASASQKEAAALTAVKAICPDFDPSTV